MIPSLTVLCRIRGHANGDFFLSTETGARLINVLPYTRTFLVGFSWSLVKKKEMRWTANMLTIRVSLSLCVKIHRLSIHWRAKTLNSVVDAQDIQREHTALPEKKEKRYSSVSSCDNTFIQLFQSRLCLSQGPLSSRHQLDSMINPKPSPLSRCFVLSQTYSCSTLMSFHRILKKCCNTTETFEG